jgi:hypothetical protein
VAETGHPSIARCEADIRSTDGTTDPEPDEVRCAPVGSPAADPAPSTPFVVLGGVLAASALAFALARSRKTPGPRRSL